MLISYLKRHYKIILMLALFGTIFAGVFALYDLPVEAVAYAVVLCAFSGAALFFLGFGLYCRRNRQLKELEKTITLSLDDLPTPHGALEEDYQRMLKALFREVTRVRAAADTEKADMVDYYTLWAHQIKSPIAAMGLLLQSGEGEDNAQLSAELMRIEQYVEMVLSYLRLDSETSDFVIRDCDLDSLLRQCIRKYARLFIKKKITLNFTETHLTVLTDEKWLAFVIEQILSNALKYTPLGSIAIYAEGDGIVIRDTGIGIRAEDIPRVFEKGYTGFNGREDKKASGIGLYLCRRVCHSLGHEISITSHPGEGTAVRLEFYGGEKVIE